jgi:undecaprenyl-diphosphatase
MSETTLVAAGLGLLEGLTEFIPVSSTAHVLLAGHFLGFDSSGKTFEVLIQLGAILAIFGVYAQRLVAVFAAAPRDPAARRFVGSVLVAFLPAAVLGVLAHGVIKTVLFESPRLMAVMLIVGGAVLIWVDRLALRPRHDDAMRLPLGMALKIGLFQTLAMVPGVSRSGATIVGALALGASKRAAAEFSFFLSMPTMAGAFAYDLWKNRDLLDAAAVSDIAVGFVAAFIAAVVVVRGLLAYVSRHGYALFGWWRITLGFVVLLAIWAGF